MQKYFFGLHINIDNRGNTFPKHFEHSPTIRLNLKILVAFMKPNIETENEVKIFFSTPWLKYFCNSLRILVIFTKFCFNLLFATWLYRYLNLKHIIQCALNCSPPSPTQFFDTTNLYKPLSLFVVFLAHTRLPNLHSKTCQELIPEEFW